MVAKHNCAKDITVITGASHSLALKIKMLPSTACHKVHNKKLPSLALHKQLKIYFGSNSVLEFLYT